MRSANKITKVNTLHRAYVMAISASGTLLIINGSEVIYYLNSSFRTVLFALHTADTAVGAIFASQRALIVV